MSDSAPRPPPSTGASSAPTSGHAGAIALTVGGLGLLFVIIAGVLAVSGGGGSSRLSTALSQQPASLPVMLPEPTSVIPPSRATQPTSQPTTTAPPTSESTVVASPTPEPTVGPSPTLEAGPASVWIAIGEGREPGPGIRAPRISGLAVAEDGVWTVRPETGVLYQIDVLTNEISATTKIAGSGSGGTLYALAVDQDSVWVVHNDGTEVARVDRVTAEVVATIEIGPAADDVAVSDGAVWVVRTPASGVELVQIDASTNTVTARHQITSRRRYSGRVISAHGSIWVSHAWAGEGTVHQIDIDNGSVTATIAQPCLVDLVADVSNVWTRDSCPGHGGRHLLRIDPATGLLEAELPTKMDGPMAADGGVLALAPLIQDKPALAWWLDSPGEEDPFFLIMEGIDTIEQFEVLNGTAWVGTSGPASLIRVDGLG